MKYSTLLLFVSLNLFECGLTFAEDARLPVIDMHLHSDTSLFADSRFCFPQPCERRSSKVTDASQLRSAAIAEMEL